MTGSYLGGLDEGAVEANERELQRLRDEKANEDRLIEEERILNEDLPKIRQEQDLEEFPPLENLEYSGADTKSEHWLLKSLGWVGDKMDALDKAVGIPGTDLDVYHARRAPIEWLSEQHFILGMAGEIFIPDSIDIATWGAAYIPNRFRKSAKLIKAYIKSKRAMMSGVDTGRSLERLQDLANPKWGLQMSAADGYAESIYKMSKADEDAFRLGQELVENIDEAKDIKKGLEAQQFAELDYLSKHPEMMSPRLHDLDIGDFKLGNQPEYIDKIRSLMKAWNMEDGVFKYDEFKRLTHPNAEGIKEKLPREMRRFAELFLSPQQYKQVYSAFKDYKLGEHQIFKSEFKDFLKNLKTPDGQLKFKNWESSVQVHHVSGLYDSLPLYDGLVYDSAEWWALTAELLRRNVRPGITQKMYKSGLIKGNLKSTIGWSGSSDLPHGVAHKYISDKAGKRNLFGEEGDSIWSLDELTKIKNDFQYRLKKAGDWSEIVNRSEDILLQANDQFKLLNPKSNLSFDEVLEKLSKLDDDGLLNVEKMGHEYQVPQMAEYVKKITQQMMGDDITRLRDGLMSNGDFLEYMGNSFGKDSEVYKQFMQVYKEMGLNIKSTARVKNPLEIIKKIQERGASQVELFPLERSLRRTIKKKYTK